MVGLISDLSNTGALKIRYSTKRVQSMVQEDQVFRPRLKRGLPDGARITDGYEIHFGARLSPAQNHAQIIDGGNFPVPKDATDRQFTFKPTIFASDYQIGLMTRYTSSSDVGAWNGGEMSRRPEELMSGHGKLIERTYVGTSGDGVVGYVEADGSNTLTVAKPHGLNLIPDNAFISVRIAVGSTVRDSIDLRQVTDRNLDTRVLTYSGADQTGVANDPIYIVGELAQTLTGRDANGLRGQVDDGTNATTIHGLTRSAAGNSKLNSVVLSNGGERRNLTEQLLIQGNSECRKRVSKKPATLVMGYDQIEKYIEFVAPQRRFPAVGTGVQGKSTGYDQNQLHHYAPGMDMDFLTSSDAMPGEVYGVSWDAMFMYQKLESQWLSGNETQNELLLLPGSNGASFKASFGAHLVSIENWGTDCPLAHFVIRDLKSRDLGD